jgi:hypothetical protein
MGPHKTAPRCAKFVKSGTELLLLAASLANTAVYGLMPQRAREIRWFLENQLLYSLGQKRLITRLEHMLSPFDDARRISCCNAQVNLVIKLTLPEAAV